MSNEDQKAQELAERAIEAIRARVADHLETLHNILVQGRKEREQATTKEEIQASFDRMAEKMEFLAQKEPDGGQEN